MRDDGDDGGGGGDDDDDGDSDCDGDDDADDNGDGEKVFINNSEKSNYFVQLGAGGKRGQPGQPHPEHRMRGWFFFHSSDSSGWGCCVGGSWKYHEKDGMRCFLPMC